MVGEWRNLGLSPGCLILKSFFPSLNNATVLPRLLLLPGSFLLSLDCFEANNTGVINQDLGILTLDSPQPSPSTLYAVVPFLSCYMFMWWFSLLGYLGCSLLIFVSLCFHELQKVILTFPKFCIVNFP